MHVSDEAAKRKSDDDAVAFDYESIETGYLDEIYNRRAGIQSKWHHDKFELVIRKLGPYRKHLDIGCGSGTFVSLLSGDSTGVDIARPQIAYANKTHGQRFQQVTGYPYPFEDRSFDLITSIEVIEHLPLDEVTAMLGEAQRLLTDDGRFVVTTPNYRSPWPLVEWLSNRVLDYSMEHMHITKFHAASLKQALHDAGFRSVEMTAFQFSSPFLSPLGWRFSNVVRDIEGHRLPNFLGMLLLATARK